MGQEQEGAVVGVIHSVAGSMEASVSARPSAQRASVRKQDPVGRLSGAPREMRYGVSRFGRRSIGLAFGKVEVHPGGVKRHLMRWIAA